MSLAQASFLRCLQIRFPHAILLRDAAPLYSTCCLHHASPPLPPLLLHLLHAAPKPSSFLVPRHLLPGGAMSEEAYQYLGQNAFCGVNATYRKAPPAAKFLGFAQVEPRDETALMAAVATLGPVAVSIDASQLDFKFYSHGVYHNKKCKKARDELDHAVGLVGVKAAAGGGSCGMVGETWGLVLPGPARVHTTTCVC